MEKGGGSTLRYANAGALVVDFHWSKQKLELVGKCL